MQHLRRADAVEDHQAEHLFPAPPDAGGEGLRRRDAQADRGEVVVAGALAVEHRVVERRHREKSVGSNAGRCQDRVWHGLAGEEHRRGSGPVREGDVVPQAVGMEELRGREANIVFGDLQHVPGAGLAGVDDVVVKVDRALGLSGRARAVEPERRIVPVRRDRVELVLPRLQQVLQYVSSFGSTVRDDDLHRLLVVPSRAFRIVSWCIWSQTTTRARLFSTKKR